MEDQKDKFNRICRDRAAWVMFSGGAAICPMGTLRDLSKSERHFAELMDKREKVITDLYSIRNDLWELAHCKNNHEGHGVTEQFVHDYGKKELEEAELFYHYLRGLQDAKKFAVKKGKKTSKGSSVRQRRDKASDKDEGRRTDDVGEHVARSGDSPTDDARG